MRFLGILIFLSLYAVLNGAITTKTTTKPTTTTAKTTTKATTTTTTTTKPPTTTTTTTTTTKTTTTPSLSTVTPECLKALRASGLARHNFYRAKHGARLMTQVEKIDKNAVDTVRIYVNAIARRVDGMDIWYGKWDYYGDNVWMTNITVNMDLTVDKCARILF